MPDTIDREYLISLIKQIRCKNNGIKVHMNKKGFQTQSGFMFNGDHFSFEYVQDKTKNIDMLLDTIVTDVLLKSVFFKKLDN